jgi:hypothetical protein
LVRGQDFRRNKKVNQWEVIYRHTDMPPDYRGMRVVWARDEKTAIKYVKKNKPYIIIESVTQRWEKE